MTGMWGEMEVDAIGDWPGLHYMDDEDVMTLRASLRRHGQLRPVVVCRDGDGRARVVDGRGLLRALRELGHERCRTVDLGPMDETAALRLSVGLLTGLQIDYAKVAYAVAALLTEGVSPDELAMETPFTAERIAHFLTLTKFDWSLFSERDDAQMSFDHDEGSAEAEAELVPPPAAPAPVPATVAESPEDGPSEASQLGLW